MNWCISVHILLIIVVLQKVRKLLSQTLRGPHSPRLGAAKGKLCPGLGQEPGWADLEEPVSGDQGARSQGLNLCLPV